MQMFNYKCCSNVQSIEYRIQTIPLVYPTQMIILYKDPNGDSLKDTMTGTYSRKGSDQSNRRKSMKSESLELEQKVILLEKQVAEQEEIIEKMKQEMEPNVR